MSAADQWTAHKKAPPQPCVTDRYRRVEAISTRYIRPGKNNLKRRVAQKGTPFESFENAPSQSHNGINQKLIFSQTGHSTPS